MERYHPRIGRRWKHLLCYHLDDRRNPLHQHHCHRYDGTDVFTSLDITQPTLHPKVRPSSHSESGNHRRCGGGHRAMQTMSPLPTNGFKTGVQHPIQQTMSLSVPADDVWTIEVTPNDGYIDGNHTEASCIDNSEPDIDSIINPSTVYNDSILTCSATASDADETVIPTYEWTVGNATYTGNTLDLTSIGVMPNDLITCTAITIVREPPPNPPSQKPSKTVLLSSDLGITPSIVYSDSVTCSALLTDDDGETAIHYAVWFVNGNLVSTGDTMT